MWAVFGPGSQYERDAQHLYLCAYRETSISVGERMRYLDANLYLAKC